MGRRPADIKGAATPRADQGYGTQRGVSVLVKICGVTRPGDARAAIAAGADWIGINFWPGSKRFVDDLSRAAEIADAARGERADAGVVGVFVNQGTAEIERIALAVGLDRIQLHGDETPDTCARLGDRVIKAFSVGERSDAERAAAFPAPLLLLDAPAAGYGGSGRRFDWSLAIEVIGAGRQVLLAGGLNPDNVAEAVVRVRPLGVDVASGVESAPGIKDAERVERFVTAAKSAADS